jgi:hypothetical protein
MGVSYPAGLPMDSRSNFEIAAVPTKRGIVSLSARRELELCRFLCVCQAAVWPVVESGVAGSGSDLSEELVVGVEPAALDCIVAPCCPPGPAAS